MKYVATLSDDNWVKFHNIADFVEGRKHEKFDDEDEDDEEEAGEEDWGDSDDEDGGKKKKNNVEKKSLKQVQNELKKEKIKDFFSGL